jgi:hypothetical protein
MGKKPTAIFFLLFPLVILMEGKLFFPALGLQIGLGQQTEKGAQN